MSLAQITLLTITEIIGDFSYKQFAQKGGFVPFITGTLGYIGVVYMLIASLQHSTIMMVNGAWDGISGLLESAAAYVFLGERFHNPIQYMGLVLIAIGLYFLKIPTTINKPFVWPKF